MQSPKFMLEAKTVDGHDVRIDIMAIDAYHDSPNGNVIVLMNGGSQFELMASVKDLDLARNRIGVPAQKM